MTISFLSRLAAFRPAFFDMPDVRLMELDASAQEADAPGAEVASLSIFPAFQGRGYGKQLLSVGIARAFGDGVDRVWLHTCSRDGSHAIAHYPAQGFLPYRAESQGWPLHAIDLPNE